MKMIQVYMMKRYKDQQKLKVQPVKEVMRNIKEKNVIPKYKIGGDDAAYVEE